VNSLIHLVQYGFLVAGVISLGRRARRPEFLALLGFIILYSVMIGAAGWMRFKLPIIPFYVVLAGAGCASFVLRRSFQGGFSASGSANVLLVRIDSTSQPEALSRVVDRLERP
jgi:hypothetical protein